MNNEIQLNYKCNIYDCSLQISSSPINFLQIKKYSVSMQGYVKLNEFEL